MDRVRILGKLVYNGLRYQLLKATGRPGKLEAISLEVTHRCFCRCRMCNIWQIPNAVEDLPLGSWTELLSSAELGGLRELDITGGEPFLRKDLGELIAWVGQAKAERFPGLKTLAITTNGILTRRILDLTTEIIGPLQQQGIDLVLACGMDAIGPLHDRIRGFPGAWEKLSKTLELLEQLRQKHSNLILGVKTTVIPENVQELEGVAAFAREHDLFTIISPCIITGNRFGNIDLQETLRFRTEDLAAMKEFFSGPACAWSGHSRTVLDYLSTGAVNKPCSAGFNTVFVRHNGDLYPCPILPVAFGNIKTGTLGELLADPQAGRFRRQIGGYSACLSCTEPGLERIALPYQGGGCLRHFIQLGSKDFTRLFRHMGLDKYL